MKKLNHAQFELIGKLGEIHQPSPAVISIVDRQGQIVFLNAHGRRLFGITEDDLEIESKPPLTWRFVDPDGQPLPDDSLPHQCIINTKKPFYNRQQTVQWPSKKTVIVSLSGTPMFDETGEVESILFIANDITEQVMVARELKEHRVLLEKLVTERTEKLVLANRKLKQEIVERVKTESSLRKSEERFRQMAENIDQVFWLRTRDEMLYISPAYEKIWGRGRQELYDNPNSFTQYIHPDDYERVLKALVNHREQGDSLVIQYRILRPDQTVRWIRVRSFFVRMSDGTVQNIGYAEDMTGQVEAEEKMSLSNLIISSVNNLALVANQQGEIIFASPSIEVILGFSQEAVLGDGWANLSRIDDRDRAAVKRDLRLKASGEIEVPPSVYEQRIYDKVGAPHWILWQDSRGPGNTLIRIGSDITERKWAESALQQYATDLQKAYEQAESATRAKSEFLANMSHEIRTPLNAVIGMSNLLLDTSLSTEQHEYVETIRTSGGALLTLLNDILDFSKIEAGKLDLEDQIFDLSACIESALDLVTPIVANKNLELAYFIDPEIPAAFIGDVTRMRQVLVNLLSNAAKFTEEGEIFVSVSGQAVSVDEATRDQGPDAVYHRLHFSVKDTGIGVPPDRLDRLFQSFSQLDASTTRKYGGTGLGLTISKRLTEMMGGNIWAKSAGEPGQGSTFHFTVVLSTNASEASTPLQQPQPALAEKQVLIVDDNATSRLIMTRLLRTWGARPQAAASGLEALDLIKNDTPFDLAILDSAMPDMDGFDLAKSIRDHPDGRALPMVLLSPIGSNHNGRRRRDHKANVSFAARVTKPIKVAQFNETLIDVLNGQKVEPRKQTTIIDPDLALNHPLRILVAEDNVVNQKLIRRLLQKMGYQADIATSGLDVLHILRQQTYDVILMDIQMPEMDGVEATEQIHQEWPPEQRPRIIAMTADALIGDRERYLSAGMDDYISKPVSVDELVRALTDTQTRLEQIDQHPEGSGLLTDPSHPIDLTYLYEIVGDDSELMGQFIENLLVDLDHRLSEVRQAINQQDSSKLERFAHLLRTSSANMGAMHLSDLFRKLEYQGRMNQLQGTKELLVEVEELCKQVILALSAERDLLSQETK